jgi:8-oxo-dGTP diphosphatase
MRSGRHGHDPEARAAGGLLWRPGGDGSPAFALIHRPRYDDWSLPKGKLDEGERWEDAAVREVEEETGLRCRRGEELPPVGYEDSKGRSKQVRYWLMEPLDGEFEPTGEVDELRWVPAGEAAGLLTYERDRDLVREAARRLAGAPADA